MSTQDTPVSATVAEPCTTGDLVRYFLRLGSFGFGGPIALAGYMQKDLVEDRRWITKQEYLDGLALAQLAPGPLAAQLAIYLGWVRGGVLGATLISAAFILPSFLMVLALSWLYLRFGGLPWMEGAFYGIGAAVIAIIGRSAHKLTKLTLGKDKLLWGVFGLSGLVTAWTESEILSLFLGSGLVVMAVRSFRGTPASPALMFAPSLPWLTAGVHGSADASELWRIAWYFAEAGAFVFGSGLAIVPFLHGGVVNDFQWLTERQFLDAVAVAMITPGPVVITVAFIGYLTAGPLGAIMASIGVFLPCYLFVVIPAPHYQKYGKNAHVATFVQGVTAAAAGAIAGAAFVLGKRAIVDLPTAALALVTLGVLLKLKKAPEPLVIFVAGLIGIALRSLQHL
ncbi:MAG: chromate transporter [Myxococcales bacterium]